MNYNFEGVPTPQLEAIIQILEKGCYATSAVELEEGEHTDIEEKNMEENERLQKALDVVTAELDTAKATIVTLTADVASIKTAKDDVQAVLDAKTTEFSEVSEKLETANSELAELKTYKEGVVEAERKTELIKSRKAKLVEAGLDVDIDKDSAQWVDMADETFDFMVEKLTVTQTKAAESAKINVPNLTNNEGDDDNVETIRKALKERRESR